MWLNFVFLIFASLCVGFILGWVVGRPRRWGVFGGDTPGAPGAPGGSGGPGTTGGPDTPDGGNRTGVGYFARRA
jgi:hypothetical protein